MSTFNTHNYEYSIKDVRAKIFYSIDFFHFFEKRKKMVEKMAHRKDNRGHERPRSLNPRKVITIAICPIIVHFTT